MLVISGLIFVLQHRLGGKIDDKLDKIARESVIRIAESVYDMCKIIHIQQQLLLDGKLQAARQTLTQLGEMHLGADRFSRQAAKPGEKAPVSVTLPKLMAGEHWLGGKDAAKTALISKFRPAADDDFIIFQRVNARGDMLRVFPNGREATQGDYLATDDPEQQALLADIAKGVPHYALEREQNREYLRLYAPLTDKSGETVAMLAVNAGEKAFESLRRMLMKIKAGKTGYVWVIGGKGDDQGHYIISKDGRRNGEDIWGTQDSSGRYFIQDMTEKALALQEGEFAYENYPWQNEGESVPRMKVSGLTYFAPWDWVIGAGAYKDELTVTTAALDSALSDLFYQVLICGLAILLIVTGLGWFLARKIAAPIMRLTTIARKIASGDLATATAAIRTVSKKGNSADETGYLLGAIKEMTENLNTLAGQVQRSGIQVNSSAMELAATAKQQETSMTSQQASSQNIVQFVEEISKLAGDLVETVQEVGAMSQETAEFAGSGQADLSRMEEAMQDMQEASKSISAKLETINEKTENITGVVTTITKVADQTNLLSLNAAIEAEKAGEYGRGFNVVAREIRRLADQTAVATLDIDQMIKDMQTAVSAGVMEMDKFIANVQHSVENVGKISEQFKRIIQQVQSISPSFENVNKAVSNQSEHTRHINIAMLGLSEEMNQTTESLHESYAAIQQLNEAARGLQDAVSLFRTV
ncbi:MAG: methyl-accepting chemotaxis protein [Gammaproteobacteria bacterium]|nr:methyl-accepting chemotaxis protein [Gammaproteobacteria bacterium]